MIVSKIQRAGTSISSIVIVKVKCEKKAHLSVMKYKPFWNTCIPPVHNNKLESRLSIPEKPQTIKPFLRKAQ